MRMKSLFLATVLLFVSSAVAAQVDSVGADGDKETVCFGAHPVDPEFPGGMDSLYAYLCRNVSYPAEARDSNITGKVFVSFTIERDGSVTDVKILRDIGGGCGAAVVEAVKNMPRWKPATMQGKPIRMQFSLPVNFSLEDEKDPETAGMTREQECLYRFLHPRKR